MKIKYTLLSISLVFFSLLFGSTLTCDYKMRIVTQNATWDGVCQLGLSSWVETDSQSTWKIIGISTAVFDQWFFITLDRHQIEHAKSDSEKMSQYDYYHLNRDSSHLITSYGVKQLDENIILYSDFDESIYHGNIHGKLSLFSNTAL